MIHFIPSCLVVRRSFGRVLRDNYFKELEGRLHTIYLSEGYSAVAIITQEAGLNVPYLDKFSIRLQRQVKMDSLPLKPAMHESYMLLQSSLTTRSILDRPLVESFL